MKYLLTGASGFLGQYIFRRLIQDGTVVTMGRSSTSDIPADISHHIPPLPEVDMVVHAAGAAHFLPKSQKEIDCFYQINVEGTKRLLDQLSENKKTPGYFVFISSVAVYGIETGSEISENADLLGNTPYAKSKIEAEKLIADWGEEKGVKVFILRLPLVVGENPPGNLGAMQKAIQKGYYFRIGNGEARKSMVLAEDVADLIPRLPKFSGGIFNLTDRIDPKINELDTVLAQKVNRKVNAIPMQFLKAFAKLGDILPLLPVNSYRLQKLTGELTFDSSKAKENLNWDPRSVLTWYID